MRTASLFGILGGWVFAGMLVKPVYAEQRPPAQATQHAIAELANAVAQGKVTLTPTLTPTSRPTPTDTPVPTPTETPAPADPPTATPTPNLPLDDDPSNAYLRPAPEPWLELALPTGRWWIQSTDCALTPWTMVEYHTSDNRTAGVNDCPLSTWQWASDTPCALNDDGECDLSLDDSYMDYLSNLPTPEPTSAPLPPPTDTPQPVAVAPPQRVAAAPAPAPVQATQAAAEPIYIIVTATPGPASPTPSRTPRPSATATATATRLATSTSSPRATDTPVATATSVAVVAASGNALPPLPFDWTGVLVALLTLSVSGLLCLLVVYKLRQRYRAQLTALETHTK